MIYLWFCDRQKFADFISNRKPLSKEEMRSADAIEDIPLRNDEIILVWQKPPYDKFILPRAAIVAEGNTLDFLAWISTYFRNIRPFTAHCRVLTPSIAHLLTQSVKSPLTLDLRSADIGLVLAEGVAYSVGRMDSNKLPFPAFVRTLSFAYAEGVKQFEHIFTDSGMIFDLIQKGWLVARELTNQPLLELSPTDISLVWTLVICAVNGNRENWITNNVDIQIIKALQNVMQTGVVSHELWEKLSSLYFKNFPFNELMEGSRESRVKTVEIAIRELAHGSQETKKQRAFLAGYMVSRIQPGTLEHFPILFPVINELRESLLWYGACSGLTPESSVDNYGNGLGWLLKRELGRPSNWLDRPNCDISLSEAGILFRNREGIKINILTLASGTLKIEVFPLINTSVKWSYHGDEQISEENTLIGQQKTLLDDFKDNDFLKKNASEILLKLDENSQLLNSIRKRVEATFVEKSTKERKPRK